MMSRRISRDTSHIPTIAARSVPRYDADGPRSVRKLVELGSNLCRISDCWRRKVRWRSCSQVRFAAFFRADFIPDISRHFYRLRSRRLVVRIHSGILVLTIAEIKAYDYLPTLAVRPMILDQDGTYRFGSAIHWSCTMPRLTQSVPTYRLHKASRQAVVTLRGRDVYLGPHGTKISRLEYDRVVAEWLANGRTPGTRAASEVTIEGLLAAIWLYARDYYTRRKYKRQIPSS